MRKFLGLMLLALGLGLVLHAADALDGGSRIVCGTNEVNQIFCTTFAGLERGAWEHLPGELKQVVIRGQQLWGVNAADDIYYAADVRHPVWVHLTGKAKEITEGGGVICIVNDLDQIWCANEGVTTPTPNWRKAPGGAHLKFISVN